MNDHTTAPDCRMEAAKPAAGCDNGRIIFRARTLVEAINEEIEHHNQEVARLLKLRQSVPPSIAQMPIHTLREYAMFGALR